MRRARTVWVIVALGAAVVGAAGLAGLPADEASCVRAAETSRPLDLQGAGDRAHLQQDLADIERIALAFSEAVARRPLLGDSPDAIAAAKTAPARARVWCEATLRAELVRTHHLSTLPPSR